MRPQKSRRRGSLRSRVTATTTALAFRPLTHAIPLTPTGVGATRRIAATTMALFGPPLRGSRIVRLDPPLTSAPTARGEWVRARGADRDDAVVLYVHGSAYAICSSRTHRGITTRLSALTGLPVFSCDYRLAPRHRFPSAADDVRAAYDWLLREGHDPDRIVLAGDSAGGHLAVDLTLELLREGRVPPAAVVALSPVVDLTMSLAAARERIQPDPMISAARAARLLDLYAAGHHDHLRLRFSFDEADRFPPTLVHAGSREMLAADAVELVRQLETAGAHDCELRVWPDQMHVFQAFPRLVPEAAVALEEIADFVTDRLTAAAPAAALPKGA
ncbi:alpha/beta hydrolase [Nocardioides caeni]|uniref:Alpha/beta hydrolase n=1 Tax=Nocardioides caeni TaxID=574700 RepID=A0A4S8N545_9ACTN|nr:alpha/beta hydrolase [Nocardioides caeni]THV11257.1 alpha/beta hydrolase [Nocardioides caeni]